MSVGSTVEPDEELGEFLIANAESPPAAPPAWPPSRTSRTNDSHESFFRNYFDEERDQRTVRLGLRMGDIAESLFELTDGFPKRVGPNLFCRTNNYELVWLDTPAMLFAWIDAQAKVVWARGADKVPQERFYAHLQMTAENFNAVELAPHWPSLPNTYYLHPPLPVTDGTDLDNFLRQFRPATYVDGDLIKAIALSLFWGGPAGKRPAFLITGDDRDLIDRGRGAGKSTLPDYLSRLAGGFIEISQHEDIKGIKTRLLSPEARHLRLARLDNLKTHRFSWDDLEALITAPVISGHELYRGEGRRPNTLVWAMTINNPSVSTDMARRSVPAKVARPIYSGNWERDMDLLIETRRWQIISDIGRILSS